MCVCVYNCIHILLAGLKSAAVCHALSNREKEKVVAEYLLKKYCKTDMKVPLISIYCYYYMAVVQLIAQLLENVSNNSSYCHPCNVFL